MISVVVPVYNVEPYLDACLRSLAAQSLAGIEVVMVDDGSTDGSGRVAAKFAERDDRFRLIRQDNAGLGAARNAGVAEACGEYLAFVDSDDLLPPHALEYLLTALEETGSDFAAGNVQRFDAAGVRQSPMHRRAFAETVHATHVTRRDELLVDRLVTNKLWRRSFWDEQGFEFPEGVLHEDILIAISAHFLASAVDVLEAPVYLWRVRPDEDRSITQNRTREGALEHRVQAVRTVARFLSDQGLTDQKRRWDQAVLADDLRLFLQVLDEGDEDYRARFLDQANTYLAECDPETVAGLKVIDRLKWHLVGRRLMPELLETLTFEKSREMARAGVIRRGVRYYAAYPFFGDAQPGVPDHVYRLGEELEVRQKAESVAWDGERLVVEGSARLRWLTPRRRWQQRMMAWLVCRETGERVPVRVATFDRAATPAAASAASGHDWSGYRIIVDPRRLAGKGTAWRVELWMLNRGIFRRVDLRSPSAAARRLEARQVGGVWVRPEWAAGGDLVVRTGDDAVIVTGMEPTGGTLELSCSAPARLLWGSHLRITRLPGCAPQLHPLTRGPEGAGFTTRLPLAELLPSAPAPVFAEDGPEAAAFGDTTAWRIELVGADGTATPLILPAPALPVRHGADGREIVALRSATGHLELVARPVRPLADTVDHTPGGLRIAGGLPVRAELAAGLVVKADGRVGEHLFPLEHHDGCFAVEFDPCRVESLAGALPLPKGTYRMYVRLVCDDGTRDAPVQAAAPPPLEEVLRDGRRLALSAGPDLALRLRVLGDLPAEETGRQRQNRLTGEVYPALRDEPMLRQAVFESYFGRQYSDSPRAILEELRRRGTDLDLLWVVADGQAAPPEGLTVVRRGSRAYYEALARSAYVVTNSHLPMWFRRRKGQRVVQTWHGATLKRIGFDIEKVRFAARDYHERLRTEIGQWDRLVSPSPWCTPILKKAFGYEGDVLETGYPRNDIFHADDRDKVAEAVRERIGVPAGKKVVLYAPTWRDDRFYGRGRYRLDLRLDLERMRAELGDDHVLMVRRHPNIVDRLPGSGEGFVFDVSLYPEMQELLLISDILVTDYSSVMFDFAITGRPMLFFTYDLENYRDELRGFYFDFEKLAPGPLLRTGEQVVDAIARIDEVAAEHADAYAEFARLHCALDDGKATARVVDQVFGGLS
ncbi:bifunctional glycosyltransferase/CDP-glycerol:glycerophosphate glycerophosphotransferase [Actinomadura hibisca]|uniref:bifunctional glycosyltransferase/CDP-glycerol:glycerophosphate glycerophosphotransferase n=1 Tax=Actinomadura hibisca TaxID=68565 RepID=UPI0008366FF6|nr:bifunctional glycosyltransferase/CDP-glycerol:glycerophosphate glycerophosphotransferase [Actinomadura hibisca]